MVIAAHPHALEADPNHARTTRWFWKNRDRVAGLVDRWELINRQQTFGWIAEFGLPAVATGDFHRLEHLETWKTLLPCAKNERAVIAYLRSNRTAYVVPWHLRDEPRRRVRGVEILAVAARGRNTAARRALAPDERPVAPRDDASRPGLGMSSPLATSAMGSAFTSPLPLLHHAGTPR